MGTIKLCKQIAGPRQYLELSTEAACSLLRQAWGKKNNQYSESLSGGLCWVRPFLDYDVANLQGSSNR